MELLGLLGVVCLILMVFVSWNKQQKEKKLLYNIKKILEENNLYAQNIQYIANNINEIHAIAILENPEIEYIVRSLPVNFADMNEKNRIKIIFNIFS